MSGDNSMGGVMISPNMKRTKEMIDTQGNIIDPETKTVLELNTPGYVPTKEEVEANINLPVTPIAIPRDIKPAPTLSIQDEIEQAEKHLADLKLKKKAEIQRMKDELAKLEAQ